MDSREKQELKERVQRVVNEQHAKKMDKEWRLSSQFHGTPESKREQEKEYQKTLRKEEKALQEEQQKETYRRSKLTDAELDREDLVKEIRADLEEELEEKEYRRAERYPEKPYQYDGQEVGCFVLILIVFILFLG